MLVCELNAACLPAFNVKLDAVYKGLLCVKLHFNTL